MFGVSVRVRRRRQQDALPTFRGALARSLAGPFDRAHSLGEKEEDGTPGARARLRQFRRGTRRGRS